MQPPSPTPLDPSLLVKSPLLLLLPSVPTTPVLLASPLLLPPPLSAALVASAVVPAPPLLVPVSFAVLVTGAVWVPGLVPKPDIPASSPPAQAVSASAHISEIRPIKSICTAFHVRSKATGGQRRRAVSERERGQASASAGKRDRAHTHVSWDSIGAALVAPACICQPAPS
jgi:hypothetical protein